MEVNCSKKVSVGDAEYVVALVAGSVFGNPRTCERLADALGLVFPCTKIILLDISSGLKEYRDPTGKSDSQSVKSVFDQIQPSDPRNWPTYPIRLDEEDG